MRLAFVADSQVDERSRFEEHGRVMRFVVSDAADRGCVALLHGGDIYERRSTLAERDAVREWIEAAQDTMPVYVVGGNHEAVGEVEELRGIAAWTEERPSIEHCNGYSIAFLPWPRRSCVVSWFERIHGRPPTPEESSRSASELLRDVLRGLGAELAKLPADMPRILLAHVQLSGARTDPDQPAMVGCDLELSIEDLMLAGADIVLLGHIHLPQHFTGHRADGVGVPVIYAGSPRRTAYAKGELVEKGYVVVEFDGRTPRWERVPTPATPMQLIEARWSDVPAPGDEGTAGTFCMRFDGPVHVEHGSEIRLRYEVTADQREAADREAEALRARWLERALDVKLDPVVLATTRARAPEVATAPTLQGRIEATWAAMGDTAPALERRPRLMELATSVAEGAAS